MVLLIEVESSNLKFCISCCRNRNRDGTTN